MRITCPLCGDRDRREFYYMGHETYLSRPAAGAPLSEWDAYLHMRDNPAGDTQELWQHEAGCGAWVVVTRNTVTHEVKGSELAETYKPEART